MPATNARRTPAKTTKINVARKAHLAANAKYRKAKTRATAAAKAARKAEVNSANKHLALLRLTGTRN